MNYKALIFDLDGTLLDTLEDLKNAVNAALGSASLPERSIDDVRAFVGNGIGLLIRRAAGTELSEERFSAMLSVFSDFYMKHLCDCTAAYPGVPSLLAELKSRGFLLAVLSNKKDEATQTLIDTFFPGVFDVVRGETPGVPRKPDKAPVELILRALNVQSGECLYVGDSQVDVKTADNACLDAVFVTWGFRSRTVLLEAGAKRLVDRPEELLSYLGT